MFTPDQLKKFRSALAAAQANRAMVARLSELAKLSPEFAQALDDIRIRSEYVENVSSVALAIQAETTQPNK